MPDWIRAAKHAGVKRFFLIAAQLASCADPGSMIDSRQLKLFVKTA
ncbi:hypothetical protein [Paraburkholderia caledonica]|uniref:Uncharacterized protein n=1 Tax=Paraburkholderia caledonica TaxID=134536 RepID=A0ABU1KYZ9_9BURK|nr:hypothetical protein [Paraburkholderia caledonica]MDR6376132.1 hypothetical protein [Paraburkholderia caledonica]